MGISGWYSETPSNRLDKEKKLLALKFAENLEYGLKEIQARHYVYRPQHCVFYHRGDLPAAANS